MMDRLDRLRTSMRDPAIVNLRGAVQWALRQGVAAFLAANVTLQPRSAHIFVVPLFAGVTGIVASEGTLGGTILSIYNIGLGCTLAAVLCFVGVSTLGSSVAALTCFGIVVSFLLSYSTLHEDTRKFALTTLVIIFSKVHAAGEGRDFAFEFLLTAFVGLGCALVAAVLPWPWRAAVRVERTARVAAWTTCSLMNTLEQLIFLQCLEVVGVDPEVSLPGGVTEAEVARMEAAMLGMQARILEKEARRSLEDLDVAVGHFAWEPRFSTAPVSAWQALVVMLRELLEHTDGMGAALSEGAKAMPAGLLLDVREPLERMGKTAREAVRLSTSALTCITPDGLDSKGSWAKRRKSTLRLGTGLARGGKGGKGAPPGLTGARALSRTDTFRHARESAPVILVNLGHAMEDFAEAFTAGRREYFYSPHRGTSHRGGRRSSAATAATSPPPRALPPGGPGGGLGSHPLRDETSPEPTPPAGALPPGPPPLASSGFSFFNSTTAFAMSARRGLQGATIRQEGAGGLRAVARGALASIMRWRLSVTLDTARLRRALKRTLALSLATYIGFVAAPSYGFWAPITVAFVASGPHLGGVWWICLQRVQGTVFGGIAGYLINVYSPDSVFSFSSMLGAFVVLAGYIRADKEHGYSGKVAAFTAAIIVLGYPAAEALESDPSVYALKRIEMTLVGIACFIIMEITFWPTRAAGLIRTELEGSVEGLQECINGIFDSWTNTPCRHCRLRLTRQVGKRKREVVARVKAQKQLRDLARTEPSLWMPPLPRSVYRELIAVQEMLVKVVTGMEHALDSIHGEVGATSTPRGPAAPGPLSAGGGGAVCCGEDVQLDAMLPFAPGLRLLRRDVDAAFTAILGAMRADAGKGAVVTSADAAPLLQLCAGGLERDEPIRRLEASWMEFFREAQNQGEGGMLPTPLVTSFNSLLLASRRLVRGTGELAEMTRDLLQAQDSARDITRALAMPTITALSETISARRGSWEVAEVSQLNKEATSAHHATGANAV